MRVKIIFFKENLLKKCNRVLANCILNGTIDISKTPFCIRTSYPTYYIYALRRVRNLRDMQALTSILKLLEQDISNLRGEHAKMFKDVYQCYLRGG